MLSRLGQLACAPVAPPERLAAAACCAALCPSTLRFPSGALCLFAHASVFTYLRLAALLPPSPLPPHECSVNAAASSAGVRARERFVHVDRPQRPAAIAIRRREWNHHTHTYAHELKLAPQYAR